MSASNIHPDDVPVLLGAAISERMLGATRRLGDSGNWVWTYRDPRHDPESTEPAAVLSSDEPPLVVRSESLLEVISMVDTLAHNGQRFHWRAGRIPPPNADIHSWYVCEILSFNLTETHATGAGTSLEFAMAVAVCRMLNVDLPTVHREMFPARYFEGLNS